MAILIKTTTVSAEQGGRVDQLVKPLTDVSHRTLRGLFAQRCVSVNDEPCDDPGWIVEPGDRIAVRYDPQQGYRAQRRAWTDRTFTIVYEDQHLLVVNKVANVLTVATSQGERNTLESRVSHYLRQTAGGRAFVVHRLDRGVSGLLVFAKARDVLQALQSQFKARKPERTYVGLVSGHLEDAEGTFRSYIATGDNLDQFTTHDENEGQLAITHYRVRKLLPGASLVEVQLETGRRNQIRVHFADAGHPVLGDPRYSVEQATHPRWQKNRLALHAAALGFEHPVTDKSLRFESDLPAAMRQFAGSE